MSWIRKNTYLMNTFILSLLLIAYGFLVGPLIGIGEVLFQYKDWFSVGMGIIVISYLLLVKPVRIKVLENLEWRQLFDIKNLMLSVGLLLVIFFSFKYLILIDPFADSFSKTAIKYGLSNQFSLVAMIVMTTIGPLWEELFFREMLIGQLRKNIPLWICIVVSVILFGLGHIDYPLFGAVLGVSFTVVYLYTKSWLVPTVMHIIWNLYIVLGSL